MANENQPVSDEAKSPEDVKPSDESAKFDSASLTHEERMNILAGKGDEVMASKQPKAEEAPPAEEEKPSSEKPPEEKPPVEEEKPKGEDEDEELPKLRFRPRDGRELDVMSLVKKGKSFQEAVSEVYGPSKQDANKEESPAKPESDESPFKDVDDSIKKASGELSDLEKKLEEAEEDADIKAVTRLTREIIRKEQEVEGLKSERKQIEEQAKSETLSAFEQRVKESADRVFEKYPTLKDAKADERKEFVKYYQSKAKDPDYADVFKSPKWPELMAREFADETGLTSGSPSKKAEETVETKPAQTKDVREGNKPEAKKAAPAVQPPRQSPSKTLTTGEGNQSGSIQVSRDTWDKDRSKMTLEEKKALLGRTTVSV
jgi:hypothetical protein